MKKNKILVIKHGALGDVILAGAAMKKIRDFHKRDVIFYLTTQPYYDLIKESPWCDNVILDTKPKWNDIVGWIKLSKKLKKYKYSRVYDLQTSERSNLYFYLFFLFRSVEWSGIAIGSSFRHKNSDRRKMHTIYRQREQLNIAKIGNTSLPDWSWLIKTRKTKFFIENTYALIVPGAASHRENKKWPKQYYKELLKNLEFLKIQSIFIGLEREKEEIEEILNSKTQKNKKYSVNLAGKTSYRDIAHLASSALFVIGNDTGPIHLAASCNANVIALFGSGSDPNLCAPIGEKVTVIKKRNIEEITVENVFNEIKKYNDLYNFL